jgi:hypothetical protein
MDIKTQRLRNILIACRTLYWIRIKWENRGIPQEIIDLLAEAENSIIEQFKDLESFEVIYPAVILEVDDYHSPEQPYPGITQQQRWWNYLRNQKTLTVVSVCLQAINQLIATLAKKDLDPKPIHLLSQACQKFSEWMNQEQVNVSLGLSIDQTLKDQT